jgi:hypothetical protein
MAIQEHRKIYVTGDLLYEDELNCISALKPVIPVFPGKKWPKL